MDKPSEIKKLIKQIVNANTNLPIPATVLSVTGDHCKVKLKSGLEISDVKLKATITDGGDYMLITPKVNSAVLLLSLTGDMDNVTVIKVDNIAKMEFVQGNLKLAVDSEDNKVLVKNEDTNLYDLFDKLTTILKEFKVFTPVGPSGTALPPVLLKIEQFETKFKQLLKQS